MYYIEEVKDSTVVLANALEEKEVLIEDLKDLKEVVVGYNKLTGMLSVKTFDDLARYYESRLKLSGKDTDIFCEEHYGSVEYNTWVIERVDPCTFKVTIDITNSDICRVCKSHIINYSRLYTELYKLSKSTDIKVHLVYNLCYKVKESHLFRENNYLAHYAVMEDYEIDDSDDAPVDSDFELQMKEKWLTNSNVINIEILDVTFSDSTYLAELDILDGVFNYTDEVVALDKGTAEMQPYDTIVKFEISDFDWLIFKVTPPSVIDLSKVDLTTRTLITCLGEYVQVSDLILPSVDTEKYHSKTDMLNFKVKSETDLQKAKKVLNNLTDYNIVYINYCGTLALGMTSSMIDILNFCNCVFYCHTHDIYLKEPFGVTKDNATQRSFILDNTTGLDMILHDLEVFDKVEVKDESPHRLSATTTLPFYNRLTVSKEYLKFVENMSEETIDSLLTFFRSVVIVEHIEDQADMSETDIAGTSRTELYRVTNIGENHLGALDMLLSMFKEDFENLGCTDLIKFLFNTLVVEESLYIRIEITKGMKKAEEMLKYLFIIAGRLRDDTLLSVDVYGNYIKFEITEV